MDESLRVRFIGEDSSLSNASKNVAASIDKVTKASQQVSKALQVQTNVSQQASAAAAKMAQNSAVAGGAMEKTKTNFTGITRVLQDLPYGFNAISNNLEQLVPAAGAAGLAFSGIVSALTFASVGFGAWSRGMGGVFGSNKQLQSSLGILKDSIKEASEKIGAEVVQLGIYKQKLNDVNIPASERVRVLKEYNKVADETNQVDIKQVNNLDLINQKISAQNGLIVKRALSLAAMSKVTEAANKVMENEVKLQTQLSERGFKDLADFDARKPKEQADKIKTAFDEMKKAGNGNNLQSIQKGLDGFVSNPAAKASKTIQATEAGFNALIADVRKGREELNKLASSLGGLITIDGLSTKDDGGGKLKKSNDDFKKELEERKKILLEFINDFQSLKVPFPDLSKSLESFNTDDLTSELRQKLNKALIEALKGPVVPKEVLNDPKKFNLPVQPTIVMRPPDAKEVDVALADLGQKLSAAFANFFDDSFSGIGEAIGNSLAGQGNALELAGESIAKSMGALIKQIGKSLIQYGIVKTSLDKVLATGIVLPGGAAIAAGIAAIAIGQLVQASFKNVPGHEKGLWEVPAGFNNDTYFARLSSGEMVLPKFAADQFRSGNMSAAMVAPMDKVANMTGHQSIEVNVTGEFKQSGRDLMAVWAKTVKNDRIFSSSFLDDQIDKRLRVRGLR